MKRQNCWEAMSCGRQPGGAHERELGVCPAAISGANDGAHRGVFRGRMCWQVTGTLCGGEVQGDFAKKMLACLNCRFLQKVQDQESRNFHLMPVPPK
ncbi:MAG: hypothetical protein PHS14_03505 [Elusimicrobia bacterium]|nr:hypothetical protein [Elusimicrobiota bacterium]